MTGRVTDEMLMAFVDGELEPHAADDVRGAIARDAALAQRAEEFRAVRQWTKDSFASVKAEPVPEQLVGTVLGRATNVVPLRKRVLARAVLPLAASFAVLIGAAGYWLGQQQTTGSTDLFSDAAIVRVLAGTKSGETRTVRTAAGEMQLSPLAAYKVEGGICRSFDLTGSGRTVRGVGCERASGWQVEIAVAAAASGGYAPASTDATAAIDAFLDATGAGEPLSAEEEAALAARGR